MNARELRQYLESRRVNLSRKEFFALILDMLEKDPLEETRDVLRAWLLAYSDVDESRFARYWEPFLSDPDPFQRESAALQLVMIVNKPNSLSYKILTDYLGEEAKDTTDEEKIEIIMRRFRELFPRQGDDENHS
jgi:hypothetical protein